MATKISITSLNVDFAKIEYGDYAANFGATKQILNKSFLKKIQLNAEKTEITVEFDTMSFKINAQTFPLINTNAVSIEAYCTVLENLLMI